MTAEGSCIFPGAKFLTANFVSISNYPNATLYIDMFADLRQLERQDESGRGTRSKVRCTVREATVHDQHYKKLSSGQEKTIIGGK